MIYMITSLILGILLIGGGLSPTYTSLSLWWLTLGVPLILIGIVFVIHAFSIRRCWDNILGGNEEALKKLRDKVNKNLK